MKIGFSLIGTPDGFDSLDAGLSREINMGFKVDLDNKSINIFLNTEILYIQREKKDNSIFFYFTLYRHAKGMKSNRTGTYYGSTVILKDAKADASLIWRSLIDMAELVKANCLTEEGKFYKNISNIKSNLPESLDSLQNKLTDIGYYHFEPSNRKVYFRLGRGFKNYTDFIADLFDSELLYDFDSIYISNSKEVEADVSRKSIIEVLDLEEVAKQRRNDIDILKRDNKYLIQRLSDLDKIVLKRDREISEKDATIKRLQTEPSKHENRAGGDQRSVETDKTQLKWWNEKKRIAVYVFSLLVVAIMSSLFTYLISSRGEYEKVAQTKQPQSNHTHSGSADTSEINNPASTPTNEIGTPQKNKHCEDFLNTRNWDNMKAPDNIKNVSQLIEKYKKDKYELEGCEDKLSESIIEKNKEDIVQKNEGNNRRKGQIGDGKALYLPNSIKIKK